MALPTAQSVYSYLDGFGVDAAVISPTWIDNVRDMSVLTYVEKVTRTDWHSNAPVQYLEFFDGNGSDLLILPRRPVVALIDVTFIGGTLYPITLSAVEVLQKEGILKARSKISEGVERRFWQQGKRNIRITYTAGGPPSEQLSYAIMLLMAEKTLGNLANRTGGGDVTIQSHSRAFGPRGKYGNLRTEIYREARGILRNYMTGVSQ